MLGGPLEWVYRICAVILDLKTTINHYTFKKTINHHILKMILSEAQINIFPYNEKPTYISFVKNIKLYKKIRNVCNLFS